MEKWQCFRCGRGSLKRKVNPQSLSTASSLVEPFTPPQPSRSFHPSLGLSIFPTPSFFHITDILMPPTTPDIIWVVPLGHLSFDPTNYQLHSLWKCEVVPGVFTNSQEFKFSRFPVLNSRFLASINPDIGYNSAFMFTQKCPLSHKALVSNVAFTKWWWRGLGRPHPWQTILKSPTAINTDLFPYLKQS